MKAILVIDVDDDLDLSQIHANVELYSNDLENTFHKGYLLKQVRPLPQKMNENECIDTIVGEEENNGLKPLPKDESHGYYGCPSCRHIVSSVQNYCENCGQKLDWGDIGETE